jgi:flagellar motility protein MotE (MotC chaperone)
VSNKPSGVRAETVRKVLAARSNVADHKAAGHQMELQERQEAEELLVKLGKARAALEAERQRLEKVLAAAHAAPKGGPCKEPAESKAAPADDTASAEKSAPPTRKKAPALDIRAVAKQVQAMSPKKAALVLDHMDRATAAQVLRTMGARQAGAVLAALNPNTAAELLQTRPPAEDR